MSITETTRPTTRTTRPTETSSAGPVSLNGHREGDAHTDLAVEGKTSRSHASIGTHTAGAAAEDLPGDHRSRDAQPSLVAGEQASQGQAEPDSHLLRALADDFPGGHAADDTHGWCAAGDQTPVPAMHCAASTVESPVRGQSPPAAIALSSPNRTALLADPLLALAADVLSDLEKVRIANENRLRQLTRSEEDSDGETRGFGLDEAHPDVARLAALVGMLGDAEHKATLNLQRVMRKHPLGPWVATQKGIGEKQGARLLAAIGDPYIRPEITCDDGTVEPSRPRTVSELWAYCGLKPGQKRRRGEKANWSAAAKMRAWNIAGSMLKAGNRETYDKRKAATEGRVHAEDCVRCGPSGKPAPAGTPWSDGHRHADALRVVSKEILKQLWREAKRIHETPVSSHVKSVTHQPSAADGPELPPTNDAAIPRPSPSAEPA